MTNNKRTRDYLIEMKAILDSSKIFIDSTPIYSEIRIIKRDTYIKRNNKKCYVDVIEDRVPVDWKRLRKYTNHKTYSTGDNDWRPLHTSSTTYKLDKDYKEELITAFKVKHNLL